ncbi:MAG: hypothetical protein AB7W59_24145 [Acidimicrobiia bacterium]
MSAVSAVGEQADDALDRAIDARPWRRQHFRGSAAEFHALALPEPPVRTLWLFEVLHPAIVLGSAQRGRDGVEPVDAALAASAGLEVVVRRSGGAAVLLEPGRIVWADVVIPRDDPLWVDDVGRATWWVGRWWQRALAALGLPGPGAPAAVVHRGPMQHREHSDRICFAGVGPGEVLVGGRKLVGVSQRRRRGVARFQTAALLRWEPDPLAALCGVAADDGAAPAGLRAAAVGLTELPGGGALGVADVQAALSAVLR